MKVIIVLIAMMMMMIYLIDAHKTHHQRQPMSDAEHAKYHNSKLAQDLE